MKAVQTPASVSVSFVTGSLPLSLSVSFVRMWLPLLWVPFVSVGLLLWGRVSWASLLCCAGHVARCACWSAQELMKDPVVAADGFTYEREHISKWMATCNLSPSTGLPLAHTALTPNNVLKNLILSSVTR